MEAQELEEPKLLAKVLLQWLVEVLVGQFKAIEMGFKMLILLGRQCLMVEAPEQELWLVEGVVE